LRRFEASPLPIVGAVHGLALAGGMELVMACDVIFAAENARLGDQHAAFGLVPGWGGTQRLPRIVGLRRALDLMYSARWLTAGEAQDWGLVNYVVADDELEEAALDYCRTLATRSPTGIAAMKRLARAGLEGSLDAGLALEERDIVPALGAADVDEGLAAFSERRTPAFADRDA
jgi:enoyl-CoA hydratase